MLGPSVGLGLGFKWLPNRTAALVDAINGHLRPRIDQFRQLTGAAVAFYANRRAPSCAGTRYHARSHGISAAHSTVAESVLMPVPPVPESVRTQPAGHADAAGNAGSGMHPQQGQGLKNIGLNTNPEP